MKMMRNFLLFGKFLFLGAVEDDLLRRTKLCKTFSTDHSEKFTWDEAQRELQHLRGKKKWFCLNFSLYKFFLRRNLTEIFFVRKTFKFEIFGIKTKYLCRKNVFKSHDRKP